MHRVIALASVARIEELIARHIDPDLMVQPDWRQVRTDLGRMLTHAQALRALLGAA